LADRLAVLGRAADRHVLRDAPQVVDHAVPDEAVEHAAIVRLERRPRRGLRRRDLRVVDHELVRVLPLAFAHGEVPGLAHPRDPELAVVAAELVPVPFGPREALLRVGEQGQRVPEIVDDLHVRADARRDEVLEGDRAAGTRVEDRGHASLVPRAHRVHATLVAETVEGRGELVELDLGLEKRRHVHGGAWRSTEHRGFQPVLSTQSSIGQGR
jgi:hypothetical protein